MNSSLCNPTLHIFCFPVCSRIYSAWIYRLVMSLPAVSFGDRFCFSRKGGIGGGGWVHPKGGDSMAVSGLCFGNPWVGYCCPPMHKQVDLCISNREAFFPAWASSCVLSAMTITSSLMGGCGLSHECVEDGFKSTCVKFGGWNLTELEIIIMVSLLHV